MTTVRVLLAAGTDPDAADEDGWTALLRAAGYGHEEVVGALADGGADLPVKIPQPDVHSLARTVEADLVPVRAGKSALKAFNR
eukprot:COSAG06_NODE_58361_length_277_cov_0.730337_1_plen_82_part_10